MLISRALLHPAPVVAAVGIALTIAVAAWRARSLTPSGAVAALLIGTLALRTSWGWGAFLILWFVAASLLTRVGRARKTRAMAGIVSKGGQRDAMQVLANGGVFALATALLHVPQLVDERHVVAVAALASLVATGADTWATEIGSLDRGLPWSLRERRRVPVGTSGAISVLGTLASAAGALLLSIAAIVLAVGWMPVLPALAVGGFGGAAIDTLVGAWLQSRRWCPACREPTEQRVHSCGVATVPAGGVLALDNDAVNFVCSVAGALIAAGIWLAGGRVLPPV